MTNPIKSLFAEDLALLIARVPLGVYFAIAGYNKIMGKGIKAFVDGASGMLPTWVPPEAGHYYLTALPVVELVAGVMLVLGVLGRIGAGLCFLMLLSIVIALAVFKDPNSGAPFHPNYILLGLSAVLTTIGPGGFSLDRVLFRGKGAPVK